MDLPDYPTLISQLEAYNREPWVLQMLVSNERYFWFLISYFKILNSLILVSLSFDFPQIFYNLVISHNSPLLSSSSIILNSQFLILISLSFPTNFVFAISILSLYPCPPFCLMDLRLGLNSSFPLISFLHSFLPPPLLVITYNWLTTICLCNITLPHTLLHPWLAYHISYPP